MNRRRIIRPLLGGTWVDCVRGRDKMAGNTVLLPNTKDVGHAFTSSLILDNGMFRDPRAIFDGACVQFPLAGL